MKVHSFSDCVLGNLVQMMGSLENQVVREMGVGPALIELTFTGVKIIEQSP